MSKKKQVIEAVFHECQVRNDFVFDTHMLKKAAIVVGMGNPFDATKIDDKSKLPDLLLKKDYAIVHLGNGKHKFFKGIDLVYHDFEPIQNEIEWSYKKSLLNEFNSSESNILSVANNQRILHHFLFDEDNEFGEQDIFKRPKTYFPHRTKTSFSYHIGKDNLIHLENIQIEIDLTIELAGNIGVFEAKNGTPTNFAIYQIYHPFLYYINAREFNVPIKTVSTVYVVRQVVNKITTLNLWAYTFQDPFDITSITFLKSASYKLIQSNIE